MVCHDPVAAGENADRKRINGAQWQMNDKGAEDTNAQWFADPEHGWIRVEPRRQSKKQVPPQPAQNRAEGPKSKAALASFDY